MEVLEKGTELFKKIPKDYLTPILIGCMGLILFGYGSWTLFIQPHLRENIASSSFSQPQSKTSLPQNTLKVDIEGAVVNPGVYSVSAEGRVQDGLIAAGGLSSSADRNWVSQHINLALKLLDGTKIYIPSLSDATVGQAQQASTQTDAGGVLGAQNQQIDINSASESDLDSLPGIGLATANKIIAARPYTSTQDLLTKKIVGSKEFDKIKDLIVVQ